jgi:hypothetical protein
MRGASTTAVVIGLILLIVAWFWPSVQSGRRYWSDEQAKQYADTLAELHRLSGAVAESQQTPPNKGSSANPQIGVANSRLSNSAVNGIPIDPSTATEERLAAQLEAVKQRYATERAELDSARSHGQNVAIAMRWIGAVLIIAGAVGTLAARTHKTH